MPGKVCLSSDAAVTVPEVNAAKRKAVLLAARAPSAKRIKTIETGDGGGNTAGMRGGAGEGAATAGEGGLVTPTAVGDNDDSAALSQSNIDVSVHAAVAAPSPPPKTPTTPITPARSRANSVSKKNPNIREKRFVCTYENCTKAFARPCRLEEHLRSHTGERPFQCTSDPGNCNKSFLRESHLKAHVKAIHDKAKTYRCTFQLPVGVEENRGEFGFKRKASEPPPPEGEGEDDGKDGHWECGARFTTNQHLKRHLESHLRTFPHICSEYPPCAAGFRKKGPLLRHVRSEHLKLPPWACTHPDVNDSGKKCEAAYDTKGKLGNHVQMVHTGLAKKRYVCAVCTTWKAPAEEAGEQDNTTITSTEVTIKTEPSDGSLSPSFPIISAPIPAPRDPAVLRAEGVGGFTTHSELRAHISEAHPPICATCGFVAKRSRDLKTHIREKHEQSIEERRVWMCEWEGCWQDFTQKRNLTAHIRLVHQNLKPYPCPHAPACSERFAYKSVLEKHILKSHPSSSNDNNNSNNNPTQSSPNNSKSRKKRKSRAARTRQQDLLQKLTGVGYEDTGRNWACPLQGCGWRAYRKWDLAMHLRAEKGHAMPDDEVRRVLGVEAEGEGEGEGEGGVVEKVGQGEGAEEMDVDEGAGQEDREAGQSGELRGEKERRGRRSSREGEVRMQIVMEAGMDTADEMTDDSSSSSSSSESDSEMD